MSNACVCACVCVRREIVTVMYSPIITVTQNRTLCQKRQPKADGRVMAHTQRADARKSNLAMNQRARHTA
jgi:hypothetical protein